jgi:hypothetical protein
MLEKKHKIKIKNKYIINGIISLNKTIKLLKDKLAYIILNFKFFLKTRTLVTFILKFLKYLLLKSIILNNYNTIHLINNV